MAKHKQKALQQSSTWAVAFWDAQWCLCNQNLVQIHHLAGQQTIVSLTFCIFRRDIREMQFYEVLFLLTPLCHT